MPMEVLESVAWRIHRHHRAITWTSVTVIVLAILSLAQTLPVDKLLWAGSNWFKSLGWWGPLAFGVVFVVTTVLFLPGISLTFAAGAFFGIGTGLVTVAVSSLVSAAISFLVARYLARRLVARYAQHHQTFAAFDRAIGQGSWRIVVLTQLAPIPSNFQNYAYGLTQIHFWPFLGGTLIGMLPAMVLYVYIGHVAGMTILQSHDRTIWEWVSLAVGLLATAAAVYYISRLAQSQWRKHSTLSDVSVHQNHPTVTSKATPQEAPPPRVAIWGAFGLVGVALLAAASACYAHLNAEAIERAFAPFIDPAADDPSTTGRTHGE